MRLRNRSNFHNSGRLGKSDLVLGPPNAKAWGPLGRALVRVSVFLDRCRQSALGYWRLPRNSRRLLVLSATTLSALIGCGSRSDLTRDDGIDAVADEVAQPPSSGYRREVARFGQLALGLSHSCALRSDGTVACWGENVHGELGNGTTDSSRLPTAVRGLENVQQIAAYGRDTCAVHSAGKISCWGDNSSGQLGNATTSAALEPVDVEGVSGAIQVAVGDPLICALSADSKVSCWGEHFSSRVADLVNETTNIDRLRPFAVPSLTGPKRIASGYEAACALVSKGTLSCWGDGQFDGGMWNWTPSTIPGLAGVVELVLGFHFGCARLRSTQVRCWGANWQGQLGNLNGSWYPVIGVPGVTSAAMLAAAGAGACALLNDGAVKCWGSNEAGQLGNGRFGQYFTPETVAGLEDVVSIAAGEDHYCALSADETVKCWGSNGGGQLGDGTTMNRSIPVTTLGF